MKKLSILFVIVGLGFLAYGGYQLFETNQAQSQSLDEARSILTKSKVDSQNNTETVDLNTQAENFLPSEGETVGLLNIPKLESELAIIEGTHEDDLAQGVGHYGGTAYPMQNDQIVLSGHRDTVFRGMGELEIGDILTLELAYGEFSYEIVETQIVDADDRSIIVPTAPDEVLTVTTCYPFSYVGNAPDRYIITAFPIENEE